MAGVACTVTRTARAPVARLFDEIVAEDVLPKVLHRYLVVPAVVGTDGQTGPWSLPGSQRTVHTSDGRALREEVTAWERPRRFTYRVDGFTGAMGGLVDHATGEWTFRPDGSGSTFRWTYSFIPRTPVALPVLWPFVRTMWAGYMRGCADRCVALAEAGG